MHPSSLLIACGLCLATTAHAVDGQAVDHHAIEYYQGDAYDIDSGKLLYREAHWLHEKDGVDLRTVLYRCPDGRPFARKHIRDMPSSQAPDFEMIDGRDGYVEGVKGEAGKRIVFVVSGKSRPQRSATLPEIADAVIDAGFDTYVRGHWGALAGGATLGFPFLVPSRLGYSAFKLKSTGQTVIDGKPARSIRLALGAWFGFALPKIDVAYDIATRRLRRYTGLTNMRDDHGANISARIEFPPVERKGDVAQADLDAAEAAPLSGRCTLR